MYTDCDLRPKYENIDVLKYDFIVCEHCGYATLRRFYFPTMDMVNMKKIQEKNSNSFMNY